jgi:hypothetical protein
MSVTCAWRIGLICALFSAGVSAQTPPLDAITVEAQRNRQELERRIDIFVSSVTVHHEDWAFARWQHPICPLAAGFPRDQGEFILARISQVARTAGAPLGPEKCQANFLVVVTRQPEQLLKKWRNHNPRMFDTTYGSNQINRFIDTPRPVRVWYNAEFTGADGTPFFEETVGEGVSRVNRRYDGGSRLIRAAARSVDTTIVVVDANPAFICSERASSRGTDGLGSGIPQIAVQHTAVRRHAGLGNGIQGHSLHRTAAGQLTPLVS